MSDTTPTPSPSEAETQAFLQQSDPALADFFGKRAPVTGGIKVDLDKPISAADLGEAPDMAGEEEEQAAPLEPLQPDAAGNPPEPTQSEEFKIRIAFDAADENVEVDPGEKVLYLKATGNDAPIVLEIPSGMDINVTVRSRSEKESEVIAETLRQDRKAEVISSMPEWYGRLQYYAAAVQLVKVGDQNLEPFSADNRPYAEQATDLRKYAQDHILCMSAPRWSLCMRALSIHERKLRICATNIRNRSFWIPAS